MALRAAFTRLELPLTVIVAVPSIRHSNPRLPAMRAYLLRVGTSHTSNSLRTLLVE